MKVSADKLLGRVRQKIARAQASGDLEPTATEEHVIDDGGVAFIVHVIAGQDRKKRSRREQARSGVDPFEPPYTDDLFVGDLSDTHVALLNKFPVLDDHLLIVTRADELQQSWLNGADFEALATCLAGIDGLGFYNGGATAGSSQPHKHLQLVPMPVTTCAIFDDDSRGFALAQSRLAAGLTGPGLFDAYRVLMDRLAIDGDRDPYNVLVTRDRMVVIPRMRHDCEGIFLNAMGYAGSFLVRDAEQLEKLRELGPRRVLVEAGRPGR